MTSGFVSLAFDLADSGNDHQFIRFCSLGEQLVVNNQQRRRKAPTSSSTLQCLSKTQTRGHKSPLQTFSSILYISFARPLPDCRSRKQKKVITHVPGTRYMYNVHCTLYLQIIRIQQFPKIRLGKLLKKRYFYGQADPPLPPLRSA